MTFHWRTMPAVAIYPRTPPEHAMNIPPDGNAIRGKTFVITGASSGLGRGTALQLASQGANVVLAARRGGLLE